MGRMPLFHASFDLVKEFKPRIPVHTGMVGEDRTIPRVCVAPTIEGCLEGMPLVGEVAWRMHEIGMPEILHVYELSSQNVMSNVQVRQYVPDAKTTGEMWILDTPKIEKVNHYKICNVTYWELKEKEKVYHILKDCDMQRIELQDNLLNLLTALKVSEEKKKSVYQMMTETSFSALLMEMFDYFQEMIHAD